MITFITFDFNSFAINLLSDDRAASSLLLWAEPQIYNHPVSGLFVSSSNVVIHLKIQTLEV